MSRIGNRAITTCVTALAVCFTSTALAQPLPGQPDIKGSDPAPKPDKPDAPDTPDVPGTSPAPDLTPPPDDGSGPTGTSETPGDPVVMDDGDGDGNAGARDTAAAYPREIPKRPLTLLSGMSEASLDLPVNIDPFAATGALRVAYGINDQYELGIRYSVGGLNSDDFFEGKTVSVDFVYAVKTYVGVQVSIPLLLDPVAVGLTVGAPMKFKFGDKFTIVGGRDLISIKLKRFVPEIGNTLADEANALLESVGTTMPDGAFRVLGGVQYQLKPKLTLTVESGIIAQDFSTEDAGVPLLGSLTFTKSGKLDLGGRTGFSNLDAGLDSFGVALFAAVRI